MSTDEVSHVQRFRNVKFVKMLDFHNHLLPGIDDGSPDVETSILLFKGMAELGFTDMICTPHIIADTHPNTPESISNAANKLKTEAANLGLNLDFRYAAEYMLDDTFQHALSKNQSLLKLHNYRILVEFSYIQKPSRVESFSFDLQVAGYEPVLAHPERYMYYHKDLGFYEYLKDLGFELQLNLLSLTPYYGKDVQRVAHHLLKNNMYDFACTDMHHTRHLEAMKAHFTPQSLQELFENHGLKNHELTRN
jgi:tyrosine-protein phosphatase YwqE